MKRFGKLSTAYNNITINDDPTIKTTGEQLKDRDKNTKRAASVILITEHENIKRFLLLWRKIKWEAEGTPLILPGGGLKKNELTIDGALRELREETEFFITKKQLKNTNNNDIKYKLYENYCRTQWTDSMSFLVIISESKYLYLYPNHDKNKFSGYVWFPLNNDGMKIFDNMKHNIMDGARIFLEREIFGENVKVNDFINNI
jgi:8-oxo-dGTP pyrophosphatase MutT (NUDIX family)